MVFNGGFHQVGLCHFFAFDFQVVEWLLDALIHSAHVSYESVATEVVVTLLVNFLDLVASSFKLLVVAVFLAGTLYNASNTLTEAKSINHVLGEISSVSFVKLFGDVRS